MYLHPEELESFLPDFPQGARPLREKYAFGAYCNDFFHDVLGVESLSVIDVSNYEGADLIHDLNQPIDSEWHGRFDAVVDGGTLEHVFNFPTAMANLMRMTRVGGRVFLSSPANNLCGHGFYQFSPELMYRVFCPQNGFQIQEIVMVEADFPSIELTRARRSYRVVDPASVGGRVMLTSGRPAILLVDALKIADVLPFSHYPQQSDYVAAWGQTPARSDARQRLRRIRAMLPRSMGNHLQGHYELWKGSFANRRFFQRLPD